MTRLQETLTEDNAHCMNPSIGTFNITSYQVTSQLRDDIPDCLSLSGSEICRISHEFFLHETFHGVLHVSFHGISTLNRPNSLKTSASFCFSCATHDVVKSETAQGKWIRNAANHVLLRAPKIPTGRTRSKGSKERAK